MTTLNISKNELGILKRLLGQVEYDTESAEDREGLVSLHNKVMKEFRKEFQDDF